MCIEEIYKMLSWKSRFDIQLKGISQAKQIGDLSLLIQPSFIGSQYIWDNCARVLFEFSDDQLEEHLSSLLEWLRDLNWPGAIIIMDRLKIFSVDKLKKPFIDTVNKIISHKNYEEKIWLDNLSWLAENDKLKDNLPNDIIQILNIPHKNHLCNVSEKNKQATDIEKILSSLNAWNRFDKQLEGMESARKVNDLSFLFFPDDRANGKLLWENCARVLFEFSDDKLEPYIFLLLCWLDEYNTPGAVIILDRLVLMSGKKLIKSFMEMYNNVIKLDSPQNLKWLNHLSELLDNKELCALLPGTVFKQLKERYHNMKSWEGDVFPVWLRRL